MYLLALETSGLVGSVALFEGEALRRETRLSSTAGTAQTLAPAIHQLLVEQGCAALQLDLIAVAEGPGSFTGLRIGVTTAKTLAFAVDAEVSAVNTLDVIASQVEVADRHLWTVMDAQRGQLFAAGYRGSATDGWQPVESTQIIEKTDWLESLRAGDLVSGPGVRRIQAALPPGIEVVDPTRWSPTAASVGRLALRAGAGRMASWSLVPKYYRKSAAEEKRESQ